VSERECHDTPLTAIWCVESHLVRRHGKIVDGCIDDLDDGSDELGGSVDQWGRDDTFATTFSRARSPVRFT
jgi:hypothetical protein